MANTVNSLNYANTFADWLVATDALIAENNVLGKGDYRKDTGTLYLDGTLQANGKSYFQNELRSQGTGSSVWIQNNLTVSDGQVYFSNTTLGLTNAGQANIGGPLLALGSGTGLSVSNNAYVGGSTTIRYNAIANTIQANTSVNTSLLTTNTAEVDLAEIATANIANLRVSNQLAVDGSFVLAGETVYDSTEFTINAGSTVGLDSSFTVNRGSSGANAQIFWDESAKTFKLNNVDNGLFFKVLTDEQTYTSNNGVAIVKTTANNIAISTSQDLRTTANPTFNDITASTIETSSPIGFASGGTNSTSASDAFKALIFGHTGTYGAAGQVLSTNGSGTYQWAAGGSGGGGGAIPGTSITSTRLNHIANGASGFTGNTFTVPTASSTTQVRAYIDGVRQFESEYSLDLDANTITFSTTPDSGNKILIEVDGYYDNPYYANNMAFTAPYGGIVESANTIQLAIQDLESRKAALSGAEFTGLTTGVTMNANTSNTAFATTAFVKNVLNSSNTFAISISGTANSATYATTLNGTVGATQVANNQTYGINVSGTSNNSSYLSGYTINQNLNTTDNVQLGSLGVGVAASGTSGEIRAANNITAFYSASDIRVKENIVPLSGALTKIDNIGAYNFNYITRPGQKMVGVIAQELMKEYPELVYETTPIDGGTELDKIYAVNYELMTAVLLQAVKELKAEVEALKGNNK